MNNSVVTDHITDPHAGAVWLLCNGIPGEHPQDPEKCQYK